MVHTRASHGIGRGCERVIRRIKLTNFMSHADTEIELSDGLTVLVGPNNCGKSAVAVALHILSNNVRGDFMVRHGADACEIEVETSEQHIIRWRRDKRAVVTYTLNGEAIGRLKGNVPEKLHSLLRIPAVDGHDVHFGEQKKPIFLLDESPAKKAAFFASSSDAAHLVAMQTQNRSNLSKISAEKRVYEAQLTALAPRREALAPIADLEASVAQAERDHATWVTQHDEISKLEQTIRALASAQATVAQVQRTVETLAALEEPPDLHEIADLKRTTGSLRTHARRCVALAQEDEVLDGVAPFPEFAPTGPLDGLLKQLVHHAHTTHRLAAEDDALTPMHAPPAFEDVRELSDTLEEIVNAVQTQQRWQRIHSISDTLEPPPAQAETVALKSVSTALRDAERRTRQAAEVFATLASLAAPPIPAELSPLDALIGKLSDAQIRVVQAEAYLHDESAALQRAESAIRTWAGSHERCPTCGESLRADRFVDHARRHEVTP